ncbi:hypothetical protein BC835DRAFT_1365426 [Cytidiella melzeri]|nr:hypothetical protein BC835DRAFT_1365426 [Cytidiella melzeri]
MPGPLAAAASIVAAVFGTAVAVIVIKEFVYDPHIAPRLSAWRETRRRHPVLVPAREKARSDASPDGDEDGDGSSGGVSTEMQNLVARETAEWQSSQENATLRRRTNTASYVLDESNVFVPYDPISPSTRTPSTTSPSSPVATEFRDLSTPPTIYSPLPRIPVRADTLQSALQSQSTSPAQLPSGFGSPTASSDSTQSSFTPAVIGPRSSRSNFRGTSAFSDGGRSTTYDAVSPPRSHGVSPLVAAADQPYSLATSPFSDIQHPLSPNFASPRMSPDSPLFAASESDFAVLSPSLRSGMFSPALNFEDAFEISDIGSDDLSAWESVGRRTPSP